MRLRLAVDEGPCRGKKAWLLEGQSIRVGRSAQADFELRGDTELEETHFALHCRQDSCSIDSCGRVAVNGEPVHSATLKHGDLIEAGSSRFSVEIEGAPAEEEAPESSAEVDAAATVSATESGVFEINSSRYDSGGFCYRFRADESRAAEVCLLLAELGKINIIAGANEALNPGEASDAPLFNWLSGNCSNVSPMVAVDVQAETVHTAVDEFAGNDALTFVVSELEGEALLDHLRAASRGRLEEVAEPTERNLLLTFEPSWLEERLPQCDPSFADAFFSQVGALMFESNNKGEWVVVTGKDSAQFFADIECVAEGG